MEVSKKRMTMRNKKLSLNAIFARKRGRKIAYEYTVGGQS